MEIHLHATCWNEIRMLPYFFRHYDPIVSRYFFYDNGSDDGSLEYLHQHPKATVEHLELPGDSVVEAAFQRVNSLWWPSRGHADWVTVCNVDEFFWHPNLPRYLNECRMAGITYLQAKGFQMVSDEFPAPTDKLTETIRRGARFKRMDKPAFFNPNEIVESGFGVARHKCNPTGNVVRSESDVIFLLHYKHLGLDYVLKRHEELNGRMRNRDVRSTYGFHYARDVTKRRHERYRHDSRELFSLKEARAANAALTVSVDRVREN